MLKKGAITIPVERGAKGIRYVEIQGDESITGTLTKEETSTSTEIGDLDVYIKKEPYTLEKSDTNECTNARKVVNNIAVDLCTSVCKNMALKEEQLSTSADIKPDLQILNEGMSSSEMVKHEPISCENAIKCGNSSISMEVDLSAVQLNKCADESISGNAHVKIEKLKMEIATLQLTNMQLEEKLRKQQLRCDNQLRKKDAECFKLKVELEKAQDISQNMEARLREIFTEGQFKNLMQGGRRQCWSAEDIANSYTLYTESPKGYRLLQEKKFPLPSPRTLRQRAKDLKVKK
ncbi:uncharacterized protein LOC115620431 [Scaptodrosophila lebanonensis]|uniref:Uncharacterized protein LOC115620431 n=1 Tax=Drosophila lebanonensis TaxID=7225 RepID=A0A6J2T0G0_DROLE|nr:uncharacterized protein LOC115620431 [Scaptodrosophila lebanonensis]